jgi:hypothetical protein
MHVKKKQKPYTLISPPNPLQLNSVEDEKGRKRKLIRNVEQGAESRKGFHHLRV